MSKVGLDVLTLTEKHKKPVRKNIYFTLSPKPLEQPRSLPDRSFTCCNFLSLHVKGDGGRGGGVNCYFFALENEEMTKIGSEKGESEKEQKKPLECGVKDLKNQ